MAVVGCDLGVEVQPALDRQVLSSGRSGRSPAEAPGSQIGISRVPDIEI